MNDDELNDLVLAADAAAWGDSNDDEINSLREALERAIVLLTDAGYVIARGEDR